jgi:hypothetical protein
VQGNCTDDPPLALLKRLGEQAPLRPRLKNQCLILTDMNLVRIQYGPMWLDNLYVRLLRSDRAAEPKLIETEFDGRAYLTRMTLQGDGDPSQPCQAVEASSSLLIEGVCIHL